MIPLIRDIGERIINTTCERFSHGKSLDGIPGVLLSETTRRYKTGNIGRMFTKFEVLCGSLTRRGRRMSGPSRRGVTGPRPGGATLSRSRPRAGARQALSSAHALLQH